jgi:hypothetical protein
MRRTLHVPRFPLPVARFGYAASVAAALLLPLQGSAQRADTIATRTLAPGVTYRQFTDARGPWVMYLLRVDLRRSELGLRHARALDSLRGRERTTVMSRRAAATGTRVLAAVNADFFDLRSGENENNQVIDGEWWKGLKVTDSPYDTYDNVHSQLAFDGMRRPSIDRFLFDGRAWARGAMLPVLTLNAVPSGTYEGTALFTPRYGAATPRDTARPSVEAPLITAGRRGDTALYVRRGPVSTTAGTVIPHGGAVLAAYGSRRAEVQAMADGDTVRVLMATLPRLARGAA